jgi:two-component system CheB/CheR fusion protein
MARAGLDRALTPAVWTALAQKEPVICSGVRVKTNGETILTDVRIEQVPESGPLQGLLLVTFRPAVIDASPVVVPGQHTALRRGRRRMADLERELQGTRESLQSTIEELEATNEELTSANEELQSSNEEMRSTNEELKTSREELQSLNEELQTVNAELRGKVDELLHANDDMTNLLNSTDIATIFLDDALQIKRFTTQATRVIALIPSDVGRPLGPQEAAGAGMGLAYVRTLVRRHGGDVGCQSTPRVGTTFTFTIANHLAESHPQQHAAGTALP